MNSVVSVEPMAVNALSNVEYTGLGFAALPVTSPRSSRYTLWLDARAECGSNTTAINTNNKPRYVFLFIQAILLQIVRE
jgi:hypothetical protein